MALNLLPLAPTMFVFVLCLPADKYKDSTPDGAKNADNAGKTAEPLINLDGECELPVMWSMACVVGCRFEILTAENFLNPSLKLWECRVVENRYSNEPEMPRVFSPKRVLTALCVLVIFTVNNPDFKAGVMALANLLQIQRHDDYLVMLKVSSTAFRPFSFLFPSGVVARGAGCPRAV